DSESAQHTLEAHMRQRTFIPFARLKPGFKEPDISNEWTTIGVLLEKPVVRTSVNNKKYLFFKLGDLCDTTANVFIFGSFFDQFSHEAVGSVFALTCPKILPALEKSSLIGLEIEASCKILKLGVCLDCGVCKASSCKKAIDIRKGRLCTLHTELMIRKYQNAHSAFSSATSSLILGSPTKRTSLSTVGACHETYVWNDGIMISTVGENKMRFRTGKAGAQLVTPLSKQEKRLLQENTKGAKYVRTLRGIEQGDCVCNDPVLINFLQDKKDVSRVFNDDALAKLGFDPTTGKDTFTGSFKKMKLDPEKLRTNLDFGKIKECLVLGMDIPKEVFGAEEIEIEI
ncbi:hypothetical protein HDU84_009532, partial [Entophlyctis sp. JEL0112]